MKITMDHVTWYIVAPAVCVGAFVGAGLGVAGIANASTDPTGSQSTSATTVTGPQIVATPHATASQWVPAPRQRMVVVDPFAVSTGGE